jgi:DNA-binding response OmpR family regulator
MMAPDCTNTRLTAQEQLIVRLLRQHPQGWERETLLTELSRGRSEPLSNNALCVHLCHLRKKGYAIKCYDIYSLGDPT